MSITAADPPAGAFDTEHARILLVEDDVFDREYMVHILQSEFEVREAVDGDAALNILEEEDFDVVLSDNVLPGISGEQLLRECQDRRPVTSRVLLSGVLSLDTVLRSVNDGHIYACLKKPVDPNTLLTTVHNAARACKLIRERSQLIGELAQANAQIYDEQQRLLALNAELRALVTIATHDLREPLRSTRFFLDKCIAKVEESEPELVKHLDRVRRAHDRMDSLLHGLREWLHLQTREFTTTHVDVGNVIEEVLDNLARLCQDQQVELTVPPFWPIVEANAPLLRSVFENLVSNAIRFSPSGPPEITLDWREEGDLIRFEVTDKGIGIDPQYHGQIFGMFKRLESRRKFEGTGAGLAISQKIVQRHGGQIGVESVRGEGATFHFTIRKPQEDTSVPG
ncbi:MAG: signal transduction histidine kinase, partial [Myxococcota bacterium]